MQLADFLSAHKISDSQFAARIGVARQVIHRYRRGKSRPEWPILERIIRETDGQVTPNDFVAAAPDREDAA